MPATLMAAVGGDEPHSVGLSSRNRDLRGLDLFVSSEHDKKRTWKSESGYCNESQNLG